MIAWLQERADATFGAESMPHPFDFVLNALENGESLLSLSRDMANDTGLDITRAVLDRWCREQPKAKERMDAARMLGASAMVEQGLEIVDQADEDRDAIRKAQLRADFRLKVASKLDRGAWGEQSRGVNVNLNFGDLHLLAHRAVRAERAEIVDAEVEQLEPGVEGASAEGGVARVPLDAAEPALLQP